MTIIYLTSRLKYFLHFKKQTQLASPAESYLSSIISNIGPFVTSKEFFCPFFFWMLHDFLWCSDSIIRPLSKNKTLSATCATKRHIMADQYHGLSILLCVAMDFSTSQPILDPRLKSVHPAQRTFWFHGQGTGQSHPLFLSPER